MQSEPRNVESRRVGDVLRVDVWSPPTWTWASFRLHLVRWDVPDWSSAPRGRSAFGLALLGSTPSSSFTCGVFQSGCVYSPPIGLEWEATSLSDPPWKGPASLRPRPTRPRSYLPNQDVSSEARHGGGKMEQGRPRAGSRLGEGGTAEEVRDCGVCIGRFGHKDSATRRRCF